MSKSVIMWAIILIVACSQAPNTNKANMHVYVISFSAEAHNFPFYHIGISDIRLLDAEGQVTEVPIESTLPLSLETNSRTLLSSLHIPYKNFTHISFKLDMTESVIHLDAIDKEVLATYLTDSEGRLIPNERPYFEVTIPIEKQAEFIHTVKSIDISMDVLASTQGLYNETTRIGLLFNPILSATLSIPESVSVTGLFNQADGDAGNIKRQQQTFKFFSDEKTNWRLNGSTVTHQQFVDASTSEGDIVKADLRLLLSDEGTPIYQLLAIEQIASSSDTESKITGIIYRQGSKVMMNGIKSDNKGRIYDPSHSILLEQDSKINWQVVDNVDITPELEDLQSGQLVQVTTDTSNRVKSLALKQTEMIGTIEAINKDLKSMSVRPWLIEHLDASVFYKSLMTLNTEYLLSSHNVGDLIRVKGFAIGKQSDFLATSTELIPLDKVKITVVMTTPAAQAVFFSDLGEARELTFSEEMMTNAMVEIYLKEAPVHVALDVTSMRYENKGNYRIKSPVNKASRKVKMEFYRDLDAFISSLKISLDTYRIVSFTTTGSIKDKHYIADNLVVSLDYPSGFYKVESFVNTLQNLTNNELVPNYVKSGLIAFGVVAGTISLYGASYWYNKRLKKPWLDFMFQAFALRSRDASNKKFENNPKNNGGEIKSNFLVKVNDNNINATIEMNVVDGSNDIIPNTGDGLPVINNSVLNTVKDEQDKFVILYMPGLAEDIRTYQYIGRKWSNNPGQQNQVKNPMQVISEETSLPVVTMNMPPFGKSKIGNSDRYDFDNNFESAKLAVKEIAKLYGIPKENVIPWSWCLGGNTAVRIAAEFDSKGVILDAVPTDIDNISIPKAIMRQGLWGLKPFILSKQIFDLSETIKKIKNTNILVRHRKDDTVVDFKAAQKYLSSSRLVTFTEPKRDENKRKKVNNIPEQIFNDPNFRYDTGHYLEKPNPDLLNKWINTFRFNRRK